MRRFTLSAARNGSPMARTDSPAVALTWVRQGGHAFDTANHRWVTP